jgi:hypothetical protein
MADSQVWGNNNRKLLKTGGTKSNIVRILQNAVKVETDTQNCQ